MASLCGDHAPHGQHLLKLTCVVIATALLVGANRIDNKINPRGCGESEPIGRVYMGKPIAKESVPWIVQLSVIYGSETYLCGGSIITRNVILTAGHCLLVTDRFPDRIDVHVSSTKIYQGTRVKATRLKVHPRFLNQRELLYDVALLKLEKNLQFNRKTKPVCLPEEKLDVGGKSLLVAGWGQTETVNTSEVLLYTHVDGMTDEACRDFIAVAINPYTRRHIKPGPAVCAKGSKGNSCHGDSGGPLTLQDEQRRSTQVGLVSAGASCSPGGSVLYASTALHLRWIKNMLNRPGKWTTFKRH
ncbi:trypsin 5G1 [Rhipicephalus microplus]|uniref:trypsin 5G1 n=1 Tax=Rhipicephalus microplus TaxID=6941 RepID=UPI003F6B4576